MKQYVKPKIEFVRLELNEKIAHCMAIWFDGELVTLDLNYETPGCYEDGVQYVEIAT